MNTKLHAVADAKGRPLSFFMTAGYGDPRSTPGSQAFDQWLAESMELDGPQRAERLTQWADAPSARFAHPPAKEEHLLPLMVAAGAAEGEGARVYAEEVLSTAISGFRFN